jgi:hypothetical protein
MRDERRAAVGTDRGVRPIKFVDSPDRGGSFADDAGLGHDGANDGRHRERLRNYQRNPDVNRHRSGFDLTGRIQVVQSVAGSGG